MHFGCFISVILAGDIHQIFVCQVDQLKRTWVRQYTILSEFNYVINSTENRSVHTRQIARIRHFDRLSQPTPEIECI